MSKTAVRKFTAHYAPKPAGSPIPAPWSMNGLAVICTDTGRLICTVDDSAGVIRAERSARLISAAPELAAALESARAELADSAETVDDARATLSDALDGIRPAAEAPAAWTHPGPEYCSYGCCPADYCWCDGNRPDLQ